MTAPNRRWTDADRELVAAGTWGGLDFNAVKLLVTHQRRDIGSCLCGWGVNTGDLGRSHALHVWRELQRAVLLDHDARVRAETLDEAEQAILHEARLVGLDIDGVDDSLLYIPAIRALRRIARAHPTTPPADRTEEATDAEH